MILGACPTPPLLPIDHYIPHVTKRKMDSGRKPAAILVARKTAVRSLWSVSTAKHFASSLRQRGMQVSLFASVSVRPR